MSGTVAERKRLVRVTAGNIRNSHIYITGHHDFSPSDCLGDSRRNGNGTGKNIRIHLTGLNKAIETDIACDAMLGLFIWSGRILFGSQPRSHFKGRRNVSS